MTVYFSNFFRFLHNYYFIFLAKLQLMLKFVFSNIHASGAYYIGDWKDGDRHGNGEYHWNSGHVYKGQCKNGKENGHGTMTYPDGTKETGKFKDGKFLG